MGSITNPCGLNSAANAMPMIAGVEITTDEAGASISMLYIGLVVLVIIKPQTNGCDQSRQKSLSLNLRVSWTKLQICSLHRKQSIRFMAVCAQVPSLTNYWRSLMPVGSARPFSCRSIKCSWTTELASCSRLHLLIQ